MHYRSGADTMSLGPQSYRRTDSLHRIGLVADKPLASDVLPGTLWHSSDIGTTERSNGTEWVSYFNAGLSSSVFFYRIDTTTTNPSDPGSGKLRYNNANQHLATTLIVDWLTDDGFDAHLLFLLFAPTTRFLMQDKALANSYQIWEITAPATNLADFFTVPVSFVSSGGPGVFSHNQRVAVIILPPAASGII